jgi:hypothetical protein
LFFLWGDRARRLVVLGYDMADAPHAAYMISINNLEMKSHVTSTLQVPGVLLGLLQRGTLASMLRDTVVRMPVRPVVQKVVNVRLKLQSNGKALLFCHDHLLPDSCPCCSPEAYPSSVRIQPVTKQGNPTALAYNASSPLSWPSGRDSYIKRHRASHKLKVKRRKEKTKEGPKLGNPPKSQNVVFFIFPSHLSHSFGPVFCFAHRHRRPPLPLRFA